MKVGSYAPTFRYGLFIPASWYKMKGAGFFFSPKSLPIYQVTRRHIPVHRSVWTAFRTRSLTEKLRFALSFLMIDVPLSCTRRMTPSRIEAAFSGEAFLTAGRHDDPSRHGEMRVQD